MNFTSHIIYQICVLKEYEININLNSNMYIFNLSKI